MLKTDKQSFIKMLIYKSSYMGCRENDIIFGQFAVNNLHNLLDNELLLYQELLEQNDAELFAWITKQKKAPRKFSALIKRIVNYKISIKDEFNI
jgi:antitoxin CptB